MSVSVPLREAEPPLVLALDVGSSSTRALVFDARARLVEGCGARVPHELATSVDGSAELDARLLVGELELCIDAALAEAGARAGELRSVGLSSFWHGLTGLDEAGEPVTPIFMWADSRSAEDTRRLRFQLDGVDVHRRTGAVLHPSYWPAKLAWLVRTRPAEELAGVRWWGSLGEVLHARLFGAPVRTSVSQASATGLFDQAAGTWDTGLAALVGADPARLPELVDLDEPRRGLVPALARRWPALAELPWYASVGDGAASNVGAGAVGEREIAVTVGTSAAIRAVRPGPPRVTPNLWTYRIDRDRPVMGGALSEGGDVYEWLVATMRLSRHAQDRAARLTPDGHGLTVLPLLGGERSPGWSLDARGVLAGLSLATKPEEILLATFESVAYRLAALHDILVAQLPSLPRIVATGGALLSSPLWCRIIADVLGRPLGVSAEPESSCRGVALLALEREGAIAALDAEPAALATTLEPDPARHLAYVAARARQDDLYARLFGAGS